MEVVLVNVWQRWSCKPESCGVGINIRWEDFVSLQISIRQYNDVTIVDLSGKSTIDASEGELLSKRLRALTDYGTRKVLLNLADLTQMDSTGISAIVESYFCLQRQDGELKLLGPRGRVLEVLTLFRLLDAIPSFENETQALASFCKGVGTGRSEIVGAEANTTSDAGRFLESCRPLAP
jgi:anti-sigma B factor antagonist